MAGVIGFDATVSGTSSNSFLTWEEADELSDQFPMADAWDELERVQQERLILLATRRVNRYRKDQGGFGAPAVQGQRLNFPRDCDQDAIPWGVKLAVMEAINAELTTNLDEIKRPQAEGVTSQGVLGASVSLEKDESLLPAEARSELDELAKSYATIIVQNPKVDGESQSFFFDPPK